MSASRHPQHRAMTSTAAPSFNDGAATWVDAEPDVSGSGSHESERKRKSRHRKGNSLFDELWFIILVAFFVIVIVKGFVIQTFYIPSGSMELTLLCNDRVLVNRLSYLGDGPSRGDVIVFRHWEDVGEDVEPMSFPQSFLEHLREGIGLGHGGQEDLIKRVIGLPGETVEVRDSRAYINGEPLSEPYVFPKELDGKMSGPSADFGPVQVPPGHYFVMGDHRNNSQDSRQQVGGRFVDKDAIVGRAFVRFWPFSRFGGLQGPPKDDNPALCESVRGAR